ncbi:hypothetical protein [Vogesella indigofera]|uniref:hypothetical protein n=1 Tax=Vogesella indigofera TaxID=45465 RepID=UPI0014754F17|nr:hypothetical protein [Vogesella indigofera]
MKWSAHAKSRSQQRGIPLIVVDLLERFGSEDRTYSGGRKVRFDKKGRRLAEAFMGPLAKALDKYWNCYAVIAGDGTVVTVAHAH